MRGVVLSSFGIALGGGCGSLYRDAQILGFFSYYLLYTVAVQKSRTNV